MGRRGHELHEEDQDSLRSWCFGSYYLSECCMLGQSEAMQRCIHSEQSSVVVRVSMG
jgi:hypothetical protein